MNTIDNITRNTYEDFGDEYASSVTYKYTNLVFKSIRDKMDLKEGDLLDEAIDSALTTLQFGIMSAVIIVVNEYIINKSILLFVGLVSYVKGTSFIRSLKSKGSAMFNNLKKVKGRGASRALSALSSVVSGKQKDTLAIAQMANSSTDNILTNVSIERQNQILLTGQKINRTESTKSNIFSVRNKSRDKNMTLFVWKTSNGMWEKTQKDEKLYKDCVGADSITVPFNADFVLRLNSLADVVKTAKGEIISRAKAEIDMITAIGANVKG